MKTIDLRKFNIIKEGIEFCVPDGNTEPGLEELLPTMERNEGAVYWLQPKGGTVEQQEACIRVNGMFYALSSKVEKAIFRRATSATTRDSWTARASLSSLGDFSKRSCAPHAGCDALLYVILLCKHDSLSALSAAACVLIE
jgi:hypothetical protein